MKRWLREPLVHFLIAGALLFGAYGWLNRGTVEEPRVVRITAADVNWLTVTWSRLHRHPPTEEKLRGLVNDYLKEELLAREARTIGLDQDDTIVRRRLAQKMEFLVEDTIRVAEPGDDVLRRFYEQHRTPYQIPVRLTFTQIYFKSEANARQGLRALAKHRNPDDLGDPNLLGRDYSQADEDNVSRIFGEHFATSLFALQTGKWQGPVASTYGYHVVRIDDRQDAQARPFEQVRVQVLTEWRRTQEEQASREFYARLLKKYDVVVDESVKRLVGKVGQL